MMKKLFVLLSVLCISFMSCAPQEEEMTIPEEYNSDNIKVTYTTIDYEIVELINAYRITKGLQTLSLLNEASKEAITHNQYMVNQGEPSHDYFYLRSQNLKKAVNAQEVSENVGYGFTNAQALVNAWINSDNHRQNLENPELTNLGISTIKDQDGNNYFTNIFIKL